MAKLSLKVYLMMPDLDTYREVRRFGIDADVASNFLYLREKLQTIFPDLRGKIFNVTWKDDEDENITISTNEELEISLDEMGKKNIYKMYVWLQPEQDGIDMSKIEKTIHPGVMCDVCDKNIHGFRFKCMQCRDYDLCTDCMTLGNHLEHYMIRMTQPVEWSSYHGHRLAHHVRKFIQKAQHHKEDERRCPKGSHKGLHKRSGCPAFNAAEFDERQEKKRAKEQHREPSAESATEATEDAQQEATRHSFSQLLKIVEDNISNISQFLDPLGINVTVMADSNDTAKSKPAENGAQTRTGAQKPAEAHASTEDSAKKFPGEGKKLRDDPVSTATVPSMDNAQKDSAAAAPVAATAAASTSAAAATSAEQAAEAEEWTMIQRESSVSPTSSLSSLNGAIPKQVASPSAPPAPAAEPEKTPSNQRLYPPLPEEVRPENLNPKIQRAVDAMMAMGFTNEGAWLTHLLIAQNGDIDKALDVIHPVRRH
ncbi:PREDICTED: sequestosome-1 isoform X2 [Wasmannia auropunctata]|uniref:sequestosome-1 isoform X2 n=1 Tax=Wasmannia auropunctata TaxID=64793 RepID=UPI0005EEF6A3|nr:PREDICTED: sequestosome-1 isoform X2 [Wasmannia auropunctata]